MVVYGIVTTVPTIPIEKVICMNILNQGTSNMEDINVLGATR